MLGFLFAKKQYHRKTCYLEQILMIKLSRTGWNNVIIFSVMAFILLINVTQNRHIRNDSDIQSTSI